MQHYSLFFLFNQGFKQLVYLFALKKWMVIFFKLKCINLDYPEKTQEACIITTKMANKKTLT